LGEKETRELIEYIEKSTDIDTLKKEIISELMKVMATKEELFATKDELKEEINKIWNELYKLREEITKQGADLRNEINKLRLETVRMFYLIIFILIILNGDKIINFLKFLIK
ncbi:MAG: hypothetical protein ACE5KT_12250, partial [Methanosarcinales archaeon]